MPKSMRAKKRQTPAPKNQANAVTGERPPVGPPMEFRNSKEDAWYSVNLVLRDDTLVVKYREFSDDPDEEYNASELTTADEINAFRRRFRPLSEQLEASDCWMVKEGMKVCALREFAEDDRRFYDATVEAKVEEHTVIDGVDNCSCSFVLSWLHGPEAGTLTSASVEDLCPIHSSAKIDPRLDYFLQIAKWKHGITSLRSDLFRDEGSCDQQSPVSSSEHRYLCTSQKSESAVNFRNASPSLDDQGHFAYERNEDVDLGGGDCILNDLIHQDENEFTLDKQMDEENGHCFNGTERLVEDMSHVDLHRNARFFILVDNLEKDVSPTTIVDFVRDATSVKIEAFVFMSLSSVPYTQGALVVNSVQELERLVDFVTKQDRMIISSKGRPWIVPNSSVSDLVNPSFWCLEPDLEKKRLHSTEIELKIVKLGSKEYSQAEKWRDLFLEFAQHLEQLYKRLALEEEDICNTSS